MDVFVMNFLFLLLLIRITPRAIIFYIFFRDARQSLVDLYRVVSSLVLDDEIQDLKKAFPDFGEFPFLYVSTCLLDKPGKRIVLFDVETVKYFSFGLNGNTCTKVKHVCFG